MNDYSIIKNAINNPCGNSLFGEDDASPQDLEVLIRGAKDGSADNQ